MKAPAFDYIKVATVAEACAALVQHGPDARLLAGGQSLLPAMNLRLASPSVLIDIGRVHGLDGIEVRDGKLRIGALVRHETALRDAMIANHVPLLTEALRHVAHPAIRARGTIGGNLAHADPASELPACMLALSAVIEVTSPSGTRHVAAEDFFVGLFQTVLLPDEMLTAVEIPLPAPAWFFQEIARRSGDYAIVGLAASGTRLAFFSVADRPVLRQSTAALDLDPPSDLQATGAMRRHLANVLRDRALVAFGGRT
ncbi:MAG TPA: xanthine dehydrogenase family protein subunit M [Acetobacteraceae bacterium]|jgi:carbon-monoxide dehydrogenase medium subunit|nr:xanthine dehydrogenase family protein subunit M [Acetobacteraceae bacterium]HEX4366444.1 xanthine dehydrogenase family protein subunit M [Rhodopila sp.]